MEALQLYEHGVNLILALRQSSTVLCDENLMQDTITPMLFWLGAAAMVVAGYPASQALSLTTL
jgi:hypothetical protein